MTPPDPHVAQRKAADSAASVWVAASAGTGKTKVLTDRVLALLLEGNAPQRILCLTFTKAAAAEMAIRLNDRLSRWAIAGDGVLAQDIGEITGEKNPKAEALDEARRLFARLLDTPGGMRIDTIHAFCQGVLRRFPIEAGIAPHFAVLDERSAAEALLQARSAILDMPALEPALGEIAGHTGEGGFAALIAAVTAARARLEPLLAGGIDPLLVRLRALLNVGAGETAALIVAEACRNFDDGMVRGAARALLDSDKITDRERGAAIIGWLEAPAERAARFDDYVACYLTRKNERRKAIYTRNFLDDEPQEAQILDAECERVTATVARCRAATLYAATAALLRVADALLQTYRRHKQRRALLDYDDLILHTRDLLRRPGVAPWVLFKLDGGLDHILIDEAQDTNPEQWQVIADLAAEFFAGEGARERNRTIFAVGDVKQSIFSFQGADPTAFPRMRDHFAAKIAAAKQKLEQVDLDISFRSVPAVLQAVDAVFARGAAAAGVVPEGARLHHLAQRAGMGGLVELWPPVGPEKEAPESAWDVAADKRRIRTPPARLARAVAERIKRWIDNKELLAARDRPVMAGDILVLVRRRNAFVVELIRALKELNVAVAGADRMRLTEQLAVEDLIALGNFLLLPEDELTLATVLKSPLFDWDDDLLYALAQPRRRPLWAELRARAAERPEFGQAAAALSALLARADFVPPYELYAELLGARGGRRAMLRRLGPDAADPLDEFLAAALSYERLHGPSLQGFLAWLVAGEAEVKRDLDQRGRDEVRIMTVHGAKGLQAPIVILPDTRQAPATLPVLLWSADGLPLWCGRDGGALAADLARQAAERRRDEEYRRLLYVAMTRAEDRLYIGGWDTQRAAPEGNWYELVKAGLENCPDIPTEEFAFDGPDGWSGLGLRLQSSQTAAPERGKDAIERARPPEAPEPSWLRAAPRAEPTPPRPLAPSRPMLADPPARSPLGAEGGDRFKRGRLVHRLLQGLPELPPAARAAAGRDYLGLAIHDLAPEQAEEILNETLAILEKDSFVPLFGPHSKAEVPVVAVLGDRAISGQIDRLVVLPDRVLIVDYKTLRPAPRDPASVPAAYLHQLAAYRAAIAAIYPGRPVEAAILWTDGPILMPIPGRLLDLSRAADASQPAGDAGAIA
jgi:ATP-dependent helicase/nuclease subunit A